MTDLTRDDMIDGLRELVRELHALGEAGGVRIVGGAAMLLRYYGERRVTPDIDAKLHPRAPAIRIAEQIARRRGWNEDWLNAKAATFIPIAIDVGWEPLYDDDDVSVWVISPEALLAMKIRASRPTRDDADIAVLLALTSIRTVDEAEELDERYYPGELPKDVAYVMLEDIFEVGLPDPPPAPPLPDIQPGKLNSARRPPGWMLRTHPSKRRHVAGAARPARRADHAVREPGAERPADQPPHAVRHCRAGQRRERGIGCGAASRVHRLGNVAARRLPTAGIRAFARVGCRRRSSHA